MRGRERRGVGREQCRHGGAAMAAARKLAGERETRPSGHDSMNRGRRGREEVKAISPSPRTRPEDTADAVVAMASGENPAGVHGWALEAMIHEVKGTGRRRGTRGSHRG